MAKKSKQKTKTIDQEDQNSTNKIIKRSGILLADLKGEILSPDDFIQEEAKDSSQTKDKEETVSKKSDELYASFVKEVSKLPRLSESEEYSFGVKSFVHNDEKSAKKLVVHNMRLAIKIAHQYKRNWTSLMDLVQEASAGLVIAAKRWDPNQNTRFGTYASYWIKAQLSKFLLINGRLIHTGNTRAGRKLYFNLPKIRQRLLAEGKEASVDLIAKEVGEDPREVALVMNRLDSREMSLSAPASDSSSTIENLVQSEQPSPEKLASKREIQQLVKKLMKSFEKKLSNKRDVDIWKNHLVSSQPMSLVDLGKRYNISKQRMGQLSDRLKKSFRCHIIDELGPDTQLSWLFTQ